ncbi:hypothetical protein EV182_003528 [Spiromyces aspiralis]|uniref:Uncharacterized protein n=1 Tax=Spiromyces aspiralis TaxID=68401 RepID=A0ACC1HCK4_9FUNG|nr:hypothetical protein EV182_003528 [Spiromyces aspiralis]
MAGDFNDTIEAAETSVVRYIQAAENISEVWSTRINRPVATSPSSKHKIDHIFASTTLVEGMNWVDIERSGCMLGSDHGSIWAGLQLPLPQQIDRTHTSTRRRSRMKRKITEPEWSKFKGDVDMDISKLLTMQSHQDNPESPQKKVDQLHKVLSNSINNNLVLL